MAMDSNKPYQRVSVQANHNDTVWNGAAWGAGAGIGALGLTYGATTFGSQGLAAINRQYAGNKMTRMITRDKKASGSPFASPNTLAKADAIGVKSGQFQNRMAAVGNFGNNMLKGGWRKTMVGGGSLMGGMLAGGAIDHFN